ncbi:hypothetical protein VC83_00097 [Pseudogymnoascus destructans]|uniref:Transposase MuDR plant domain-containing protein n=2 Tax=Pseudogymnoascus destructans TaxID=655981 RepID=L8G5Q1_PSED2|nr:uncharacterized protein VC83_00097 [Pseudogymnoascus destructans]ELR08003.1 hypothetical protein GMDG_08588 [Pseudogymnoascus destructans 20631-21]OAF63429.1 hypothetical protein VC83_00097 [Pseudogymnoascus destructans]
MRGVLSFESTCSIAQLPPSSDPLETPLRSPHVRHKLPHLPCPCLLAELAAPVNSSEFLDLDAWSHALDDWAVKEKFSWRLQRRDKDGATAVCPEEGCAWRVRASPNDELPLLIVGAGSDMPGTYENGGSF